MNYTEILFNSYASNAEKKLNELFQKGQKLVAESVKLSERSDSESFRKQRKLSKLIHRLTKFASRIINRCDYLSDKIACIEPKHNESIVNADLSTENDLPPFPVPGDMGLKDMSPNCGAAPIMTAPLSAAEKNSPYLTETHSYIHRISKPSAEEAAAVLPPSLTLEQLKKIVMEARREESFGQALARLRESCGLKIVDFCDLTLLSATQYNQYKNNEDTPHRFKLQRIICGMNLSYRNALDLWQKAGYNLYKPEDRLFFTCLEYGIYDLYAINTLLYYFFNSTDKLVPIPVEKC